MLDYFQAYFTLGETYMSLFLISIRVTIATTLRQFSLRFQMKYSFEPSQLVFLRLLSNRARQNITYHCRNSAAWFNKENNGNTHSIKIMGDNGIEFHASSSNKFRPTIIRDECHVSIYLKDAIRIFVKDVEARIHNNLLY